MHAGSIRHLSGNDAFLQVYRKIGQFQEQSAFTHAFREWSGMNPGAWRERALAGNR